MTVLVDSDVLIEVARGRNRDIISRWIDVSASADVLYSPVSAAELWAGARPNEYDVLENLFHALTCVPIDGDIGRLAGHYLRQYRKSHSLELGDAVIAAGAVANRAALWTRNRKHYPMRDISFLEF